MYEISAVHPAQGTRLTWRFDGRIKFFKCNNQQIKEQVLGQLSQHPVIIEQGKSGEWVKITPKEREDFSKEETNKLDFIEEALKDNPEVQKGESTNEIELKFVRANLKKAGWKITKDGELK